MMIRQILLLSGRCPVNLGDFLLSEFRWYAENHEQEHADDKHPFSCPKPTGWLFSIEFTVPHVFLLPVATYIQAPFLESCKIC